MSAVSKGKILIIEDEAGFRCIYEDVIAADGYTVVVAEDGEQGFEMVKSEKPDLVLLDLVLPKLHGLEVLKRIRADDDIKDTIVLIMTVLGEQRHIQKSLELGANDYTVKGFYTPHEILGKIDDFLMHTDSEKQVDAYNLSVKGYKCDATKLQEDTSRTKTCTSCHEEVQIVFTPDHSHPDEHSLSAHFACPKCGKSF